jgi:hypothetical protein
MIQEDSSKDRVGAMRALRVTAMALPGCNASNRSGAIRLKSSYVHNRKACPQSPTESSASEGRAPLRRHGEAWDPHAPSLKGWDTVTLPSGVTAAAATTTSERKRITGMSERACMQSWLRVETHGRSGANSCHGDCDNCGMNWGSMCRCGYLPPFPPVFPPAPAAAGTPAPAAALPL